MPMSYPKKISRETILEAAIGFVEVHGTSQLSMRTLASELGVTPNALYRYFPSKADLELAMADEAGRLLLEEMTQAIGQEKGAEAFRAVAHTYLLFARQQPALYELKMRYCKDDEQEPDSHKDLWSTMLGLVDDVRGPWPAEALAVTFWAYLHGLVQLARADLLSDDELTSSMDVGLGLMLAGLSATTR